MVSKMDENKLKLPKSDFEQYIKSTNLDELDKKWLVYWKEIESAFRYDSEDMIITARLVHYLGFLSRIKESMKDDGDTS
jgi:hypothetical protein